MAKIFPFKGTLYNKDKIGNPSLVTAPPYDVISEEQQKKYYRIHEYNIIRLILGKEHPEDNAQNNRYTRAAHFMQRWLDENILIEDGEPSIYIYRQEYDLEGERKTQKGFICILRLEEWTKKGAVLPHEQTLSEPKNDRLQLIEACQANLSPIFGLYSDPDFRLSKLLDKHMGENPIINIIDDNRTTHKLWKTANIEMVRTIQETISHQKLYIADGHHRYETALISKNKRQESEKNFTGDEPYNHIMIYLSNMDDRNLTILPAHRLVRSLAKNISNRWEKQLDEFFVKKTCSCYKELSTLMKQNQGKKNVFGTYDGSRFQFLTLKDKRKYETVVTKNVPEIYKSLDVVIAHNLLLDHILNNGEKMQEDNIAYVKDTKKALELVEQKKFILAILLNPTRIEEVKAVASMGMKMPGKATYFYPKPLSGLVIHRFSSSIPPVSTS